MTTPLSELLSRPAPEVAAWERTELDRLLQQSSGRVVLFGAGSLGVRALHTLRGIGVEPLCFSDNDASRWGTHVDGCPVLSPSDAASAYASDALFIVTIWNAAHWFVETLAQLRGLGCRQIAGFSPLLWRFPETFLPCLLNDLPSRLYAARAEVLAAEDLWSDHESRETYHALVRWYATGEGDQLPPRPRTNTYFPPDLFTLEPDDVLVDCGAFDGDTLALVPGYPQSLPSFHAIEADPISLAKLDARVAALPATLRERIHIHRCAVGAERGRVHFETTGGVDSKIASDGGTEVDLTPLDELFAETPVSMIKMDIEGAEFDALRGGRRILERDRPILAVCVYHLQRDLWRLPLLARELLPRHRLYLRSYEGDGFQTVFYAIPANRSPGDAAATVAVETSQPPLADLPSPGPQRNSLRQRFASLIPGGQFIRYLCVGAFNTLFAYVSYVIALSALNRSLPQRFLYLTVVAASLLVTPLNITVAFLGYKFVVFRTKGHFLREWLKCFAVYGAGTIPGLFALSIMTRLIQSAIRNDAPTLRRWLAAVEPHLSGRALHWVQHVATGKALAGYIGGALMVFFATAYSFTAHKHITFKRRSEALEASPPAFGEPTN